MALRLNLWTALEVHLIVLLLLTGSALQCGPGRRSGRVRQRKKMTPLVFKQHVPNVSEYTLGASGPAEKRITRDMPEFKDLLENYNPDIIFKDEEGTGADRMMSQRCKDKLNTLAIAVMNRWQGVKLRVLESWDEDVRLHPRDSLHFEGRAVDIQTSDKDRSKNGMLGRLAVNAGFDWVYYESKHHIHVSVKSDSSITIKTGGCFAGDNLVQLSTGGTLPISQLSVGDKVLAMSPEGVLEYSDVYMFLDVNKTAPTTFVTVVTDSGRHVTVTPSHMLHVTDVAGTPPTQAVTVFASRVQVGQYLYLAERNATLRQSRVTSVSARSGVGFYAPLTKHGTVVANELLTSCYALFDSPTIAHWSLAPMRLSYNTWSYFRRKLGYDSLPDPLEQWHPEGIHWYAQVLHTIGRAVMDQRYWFTI